MDFHWSYPFVIGLLVLLFLISYTSIEYFSTTTSQVPFKPTHHPRRNSDHNTGV